ncbi:MAG: right-handed parallel beta-helix repeat-containing protein, partial [Bacteroidia bacterium]
MNRFTLRNFIIIWLLLANINCSYSKSIIIYNNEIDNNFYNLTAGDTIKIKSGTYEYFTFKNFKGTLNQPFVVTNYNGKVVVNSSSNTYYKQGINIKNCVHFKINGSSSELEYGIYIKNTNIGSGLDVRELCTDIEISNIEIAHTHFAGIMIKDDPNCNGSNWRDSFIMQNLTIKNCYIHHTAGEGIYIGSTGYDGVHIECLQNKVPSIVYPHLIDGVNIYNNIINNVGREGLQVFSAYNVSIHHNTVDSFGTGLESNHPSGITLGIGSSGQLHANKIQHGFGHGVLLAGDGNWQLYNNVIYEAGALVNNNNILACGIYVDARRIAKTNHEFLIQNNTIVSSKNNGIRLLLYSYQTNIGIFNNIITEYGGGLVVYSNQDQLSIYPTKRIGIQELGNLIEPNATKIGFATNNDQLFDLSDSSVAINYGVKNKIKNISTDIKGRPRIINQQIDAGAFEYQLIAENTHSSSKCKLVLPTGTKEINGNNIKHKAGDTICLQGGNYSFITISNFGGDSLKPIVFTPIYKNVRVSNYHFGLIIENNQHINIIANGKSKFDFNTINGNAIDIKRSKSVVINGVTINNILNNGINISEPNKVENVRVFDCNFDSIGGTGIQA